MLAGTFALEIVYVHIQMRTHILDTAERGARAHRRRRWISSENDDAPSPIYMKSGFASVN